MLVNYLQFNKNVKCFIFKKVAAVLTDNYYDSRSTFINPVSETAVKRPRLRKLFKPLLLTKL